MNSKPYRISIVGSYNPTRVDELKLQNLELTSQAGEQLGQALAKKGFHIVAYASYPYLLEVDAIRGYTQVIEDKRDCIEVLYAQEAGQPKFAEEKVDDPRFLFQADHNKNWEVSFYQSIAKIDGMLLLGGGPSALIAGIVAISHKKPVVVCANFGGEARKVWEALNNEEVVATKDEVARMANAWTPTSAEKMIAILEAQIKRVEAQKAAEISAEQKKLEELMAIKEKSKPRLSEPLLYLGASLTLALIVYIVVLSDPLLTNRFWPVFMLVSAALMGITGATATGLLDERRNTQGLKRHPTAATASLGAIAGLASAGLFVLAQEFANPVNTGVSEQVLLYDRLFLFTSIVGLVAGLTFEAVFKRLRSLDVVQTSAIQVNNTPLPSTDKDKSDSSGAGSKDTQ